MTVPLERTIWLLALSLGIAAGAIVRRVQAVALEAAPAVPQVAAIEGSSDAPQLDAMATLVVARDPFRIQRRPSPLRFGTQPTPRVEGVRGATLVVTGIFGPPWQGVIEGIPGVTGSVIVRVGDAVQGLTVKRIVRDTIVIAGSDTTLRLTVRRPW